MRIFSLRASQRLALPLDDAWSFFSDPRNLARITPEALGFRVTSELPEAVHAGLIITYRVSPLFGVPVTWVTEITHVDAPRFFVDEQRFGPYRFWHHQHHFREIEGGTEIEDIVHYAPPTPAAPLIDRWLVGPRVREIFDHRRRVLAERFGEIG
jgi:ligand-binding SRPBCC domain-containing protein